MARPPSSPTAPGLDLHAPGFPASRSHRACSPIPATLIPPERTVVSQSPSPIPSPSTKVSPRAHLTTSKHSPAAAFPFPLLPKLQCCKNRMPLLRPPRAPHRSSHAGEPHLRPNASCCVPRSLEQNPPINLGIPSQNRAPPPSSPVPANVASTAATSSPTPSLQFLLTGVSLDLPLPHPISHLFARLLQSRCHGDLPPPPMAYVAGPPRCFSNSTAHADVLQTLEYTNKIIDDQATSLSEQYKQEQEFADEPTPDDAFFAPGTRGFGDGST